MAGNYRAAWGVAKSQIKNSNSATDCGWFRWLFFIILKILPLQSTVLYMTAKCERKYIFFLENKAQTAVLESSPYVRVGSSGWSEPLNPPHNRPYDCGWLDWLYGSDTSGWLAPLLHSSPILIFNPNIIFTQTQLSISRSDADTHWKKVSPSRYSPQTHFSMEDWTDHSYSFPGLFGLQ